MSSNALGAGQAALALAEAKALMAAAELIYCVSLEGVDGNTSPLNPATLGKRGYPGPVAAARAMGGYLRGSYLYGPREGRPLQDPLCYRNGAHLYGAVRSVLERAEAQLTIQFNSSDDNPCLNLEDRTISSSANFDALPWVLEIQQLSVVLSHVSKAACLRMIKLANPAFTGLTRNLSPAPDVLAFTTIQKAFSGLDAEIRQLCQPVSMDTFPLAGDMEDMSSNSVLAVQNLRKILDNLRYILGMELMLACQALDLRGSPRLGEGTGRAKAAFRERVPAYTRDDRVLSDDIEAARSFLREGALNDITVCAS